MLRDLDAVEFSRPVRCQVKASLKHARLVSAFAAKQARLRKLHADQLSTLVKQYRKETEVLQEEGGFHARSSLQAWLVFGDIWPTITPLTPFPSPVLLLL